eukprot:scaffold56851_cov20-Tisochrysis_lutea.AAC.1
MEEEEAATRCVGEAVRAGNAGLNEVATMKGFDPTASSASAAVEGEAEAWGRGGQVSPWKCERLM